VLNERHRSLKKVLAEKKKRNAELDLKKPSS